MNSKEIINKLYKDRATHDLLLKGNDNEIITANIIILRQVSTTIHDLTTDCPSDGGESKTTIDIPFPSCMIETVIMMVYDFPFDEAITGNAGIEIFDVIHNIVSLGDYLGISIREIIYVYLLSTELIFSPGGMKFLFDDGINKKFRTDFLKKYRLNIGSMFKRLDDDKMVDIVNILLSKPEGIHFIKNKLTF